MLPKKWWARKTTWFTLVGLLVTASKDWGYLINIQIPFVETLQWACLYGAIWTLRDGVEYNKVMAKRKFFNAQHNIPS